MAKLMPNLYSTKNQWINDFFENYIYVRYRTNICAYMHSGVALVERMEKFVHILK